MFANPLCPNIQDYLQFLYGTAGIPQVFLPSAQGIATGGSTTSLIDIQQSWTPEQWQQVLGSAGPPPTAPGPAYSVLDLTSGQSASVSDNDQISLSFAAPLSVPVAAGDQYVLAPDVVPISLEVALETVYQGLIAGSSRLYTLAVYNLAADRLINFALDQPQQTYFQNLRGPDGFRLTDPAVGVVSTTGDQGTSTSYLNPDQMRMFTLDDLMSLKTPFGREYLRIAQSTGTIWGLT